MLSRKCSLGVSKCGFLYETGGTGPADSKSSWYFFFTGMTFTAAKMFSRAQKDVSPQKNLQASWGSTAKQPLPQVKVLVSERDHIQDTILNILDLQEGLSLGSRWDNINPELNLFWFLLWKQRSDQNLLKILKKVELLYIFFCLFVCLLTNWDEQH